MTFDALERSRLFGQPIGLLRLSRGGLVERYTTTDRVVTVSGDDYEPLAITRSAIRDSAERGKSVLTITLPVDAPCADWWRPYPPSSRVSAVWMAKHRGDDEIAVEWSGRVLGAKFSDSLLTLSCEQTSTDSRARGRALRWQRGCPLPLYSAGIGMCNVLKATHSATGAVADVDGTTITAAIFEAFPTGRLAGGFAEWIRADGETETRSILSHIGDTIVLNYGAADLAPDLDMTVFPGCKHTFADCRDYFDNAPNYGGAVYKPIRSPFDGNPV